jgi:DNA-3-methyladenine glycosylase II
MALTEAIVAEAAAHLADLDPDLGRVVDRIGPPPLWDRDPAFPTLVHIILEQQVSIASARAAFDRLCGVLSPFGPEEFLKLDDARLRAAGFSRQKGRYCRHLARAILDGRLDLEGLESRDDDAVRFELMQITGIGRWTADIYLLMALLRPDIWPRGDLALHKAVQDLKGLKAPPSTSDFEDLGESWRPWRSVAARLLWHHYLNPRQAQSSTCES